MSEPEKDDTDNDEYIIVCTPVSWGKYVNPGTIEIMCAKCGDPIWISPASVQLAKEKGAKAHCIACVVAEVEPGDNVEPPTAEQRAEVIATAKALHQADVEKQTPH